MTERAPRPEFIGAQRLAAVFRLASAGAAPGLRLAGTGAKFEDNSRARRVPRLRLADARSKSLVRTGPAGSGTAPPALAGGRTTKLNFAHSASALRRRAVHPPRPRPSRSASGVGRLGRTPKLNFGGQYVRDHAAPQPEGPGQGLDPRRRRRHQGDRAGSRRGRGRLAGVGRGPPPPKAGWLRTDAHRPTAAKRATPGKGWLRKSRRPRANWYSSGPSTRWVRRSRSKDRWRTRRRSLSGAVMSGVRDLLPSGDRR